MGKLSVAQILPGSVEFSVAKIAALGSESGCRAAAHAERPSARRAFGSDVDTTVKASAQKGPPGGFLPKNCAVICATLSLRGVSEAPSVLLCRLGSIS